jgi:hypothetical protein
MSKVTSFLKILCVIDYSMKYDELMIKFERAKVKMNILPIQEWALRSEIQKEISGVQVDEFQDTVETAIMPEKFIKFSK